MTIHPANRVERASYNPETQEGEAVFGDNSVFLFRVVRIGDRKRIRLLSFGHKVPVSSPRRLEAVIEWMELHNPLELYTNGADAMRAKARAKRVVREREIAEAEEAGRLWTIYGAYKRPDVYGKSSAFFIVHFGRATADDYEVFQSQQREVAIWAEPLTFIGNSLEARQEACKMACVDDITIRVLGTEEPTRLLATDIMRQSV